MNGESYLYVLAEAGVALAGFSAIALGVASLTVTAGHTFVIYLRAWIRAS